MNLFVKMDSFDVQQFLKSLTLQGDELPIGEVQEGEFADGIVECEDTLIGKVLTHKELHIRNFMVAMQQS